MEKTYNLKLLEPFYTIIKIALLNFYPDNTKITISNNKILLRLPSVYQGILRWGYGETRSDLHYIEHSILNALQTINNKKINNIINNLIYYLYCGINKLTLCYVDDLKYKKKLQSLEKIVKTIYENNHVLIEKKSNKNFNYKQLENFWNLSELKFIDTLFLNIAQLYKIESIPLHMKEKLRDNFIVIIKNTINHKNSLFLDKYLKV